MVVPFRTVSAITQIANALTPSVFRLRLWWLVRVRKMLQTSESDAAFAVTIPHNLKSLGMMNRRMRCLIKPLAALETVHGGSSILVIGPRNEWDLIQLRREGFLNVTGLDLITYSPAIRLGDMHRLSESFPARQFDCVICGWTLSYSAEPHTVAISILDVVKNGGVVAIGVEYFLDRREDDAAWTEKDGYVIQERDRLAQRVNSVDQILELFGSSVGDVYWKHDAPLRISHGAGRLVPEPSAVAVVFSVKKPESATSLD